MRGNFIPANTVWTNSRYEERGRPTRYSYDAKEYQQEQLRSSMYTQQYDLPGNTYAPAPRPPTNARERKQQELRTAEYEAEQPPSVLTFKVTDLSPAMNEFDLRRLFQQVHLIKIDIETDNITGRCRGSALVQVRSHPNSRELEAARSNLVRAGFGIQPHTAETKRRSQYADLAGKNFLDHMTEQTRSGEYVYEAGREVDVEWKREQEELHRWTKLRKTEQPIRPPSQVLAGSRLLQPTAASTERTRNR